jgi:hypothetical protein
VQDGVLVKVGSVPDADAEGAEPAAAAAGPEGNGSGAR